VRSSLGLSVASAICCWLLPTASLAVEFAREELQEMVAASVRLETNFDKVRQDFARKARTDADPHSSSLRAEATLIQDCSNFIYARFYAKYRKLIDGIDTSIFNSPEDLRNNRSDKSVLRDPRKIAYEIKYRISSFRYLTDFQPPIEEYAIQYSARPDLQTKCAYYLGVTGLGN
jgi:hypothetical protein